MLLVAAALAKVTLSVKNAAPCMLSCFAATAVRLKAAASATKGERLWPVEACIMILLLPAYAFFQGWSHISMRHQKRFWVLQREDQRRVFHPVAGALYLC